MPAGSHTIDIMIRTNDMTEKGLKNAQANLTRFDSAIQRTAQRLSSLTSKGHKITLGLIDRVSEPGGRINGMLKRLTNSTYRVSLGLQNRAVAGIQETEARLVRLTSKAHTITVNAKNKVAGSLRGMKDSMLGQTLGVGSDMLVGAGISYGIYDTIKTYKDFSAQMSTVGAISGASAEDMAVLTAKAKEMGATTSFSATEAGKAFEYMAMAGWKTVDMTAGIEGIMNLAAASGEQLGTVSDIVTDALTAFNLQAADAGHFADVLAAASSNSNTNVSMMGYTFKYVAPLAGALKYSIEDVGVAVGLMANAGIKGEQAGTSLRTMLTSLSNPGLEAGTAMDKLGISIKNADGTVKPFMQTLLDLRASFKNLSESDKIAFASDIVGTDAMSGLLAIVNASESDFNKLTAAINDSEGAAKKMADTRMDNLAGDMTLLASAWESFQIALMEGSGSNFLREFIQGVTKDISKLTGYMEDGLDISDIGKITLDILNQLKNKFLELDGVGSILAGGALAAGLAKITKLSLRAFDSIKGLGSLMSGGGSASAPGSNVGSMIVHAQSVVVNGGMSSGIETAVQADGGVSGSGSRAKGGKSVGKMARFGKAAGRLAAPLMAAMSAYSIYDTFAQNNTLSAEADTGIAVADEKAAKFEQLGMYDEADRIRNNASEYKEQTEAYNTNRMNGAIGDTAGSVIGGVVGGAIGSVAGPAGTAIGAAVGGMAGGALGGYIGENWEDIKASAGETFEWLSNSASGVASSVGEELSGIGEYISAGLSGIGDWINENVWTPFSDGAITAINFVVGLGAMFFELLAEIFSPIADWMEENLWAPISEAASTAWDYISESVCAGLEYITEILSGVADWFISSVWTPISDSASGAFAYVQSVIGAAWDYICAVFGAAADWFNSVVWAPVSSAVEGVEIAISGAFQGAYNKVVGIFSGLAGWFETNVINPVKEKFNSITSLGSSITGLHTSSESPKANGGFVLSEQHALIGEAGPEVIIPLSSSKRSRAMDLLQRAWGIIGDGGPVGASGADIFDGETSGADAGQPEGMLGVEIPPMQNISSNLGGGVVNVSLGGLNVTFSIAPGDASTPDDIIRVIRENIENLADDVAGQLAQKLGGIYNNQPVLNMG